MKMRLKLKNCYEMAKVLLKMMTQSSNIIQIKVKLRGD